MRVSSPKFGPNGLDRGASQGEGREMRSTPTGRGMERLGSSPMVAGRWCPTSVAPRVARSPPPAKMASGMSGATMAPAA